MNVENATRLLEVVRAGKMHLSSGGTVTFNMDELLGGEDDYAEACILGFGHLLSGGELRYIDPHGQEARKVINNVAKWLDIEPKLMKKIAFPSTFDDYDGIKNDTAADFLDAVLFKEIDVEVAENIFGR